jgi:hypothetical protein
MTATRAPKYPKYGTPEYDSWRRGAENEAALMIEGMTEDGREFFECVQMLAQRGDSPHWMVRNVTLIYACGWPLRQRVALAWGLVLGR